MKKIALILLPFVVSSVQLSAMTEAPLSCRLSSKTAPAPSQNMIDNVIKYSYMAVPFVFENPTISIPLTFAGVAIGICAFFGFLLPIYIGGGVVASFAGWKVYEFVTPYLGVAKNVVEIAVAPAKMVAQGLQMAGTPSAIADTAGFTIYVFAIAFLIISIKKYLSATFQKQLERRDLKASLEGGLMDFAEARTPLQKQIDSSFYELQASAGVVVLLVLSTLLTRYRVLMSKEVNEYEQNLLARAQALGVQVVNDEYDDDEEVDPFVANDEIGLEESTSAIVENDQIPHPHHASFEPLSFDDNAESQLVEEEEEVEPTDHANPSTAIPFEHNSLNIVEPYVPSDDENDDDNTPDIDYLADLDLPLEDKKEIDYYVEKLRIKYENNPEEFDENELNNELNEVILNKIKKNRLINDK